MRPSNTICFFKTVHFQRWFVVEVHCWKHEESTGCGEDTHPRHNQKCLVNLKVSCACRGNYNNYYEWTKMLHDRPTKCSSKYQEHNWQKGHLVPSPLSCPSLQYSHSSQRGILLWSHKMWVLNRLQE